MDFQISLGTRAGFAPDFPHFFRTGTSTRAEKKHLDTKPSHYRSHFRSQTGTLVVTTCLLLTDIDRRMRLLTWLLQEHSD